MADEIDIDEVLRQNPPGVLEDDRYLSGEDWNGEDIDTSLVHLKATINEKEKMPGIWDAEVMVVIYYMTPSGRRDYVVADASLTGTSRENVRQHANVWLTDQYRRIVKAIKDAFYVDPNGSPR